LCVHGGVPRDECPKTPLKRRKSGAESNPAPYFFTSFLIFLAVVQSSLLLREEGITIFSRTPEENHIILTSFRIQAPSDSESLIPNL